MLPTDVSAQATLANMGWGDGARAEFLVKDDGKPLWTSLSDFDRIRTLHYNFNGYYIL